MQQACGWLGWTPSEFWESTLADLWTALEGLLEWERDVEPPNVRADAFDRLLAMAAAEKRAEQEGEA